MNTPTQPKPHPPLTADPLTDDTQRTPDQPPPTQLPPTPNTQPLEDLIATLREPLEALAASGHYLVILFHLNGTKIKLDWRTRNFPTGDIPQCLAMLEADLPHGNKPLVGSDSGE